MADYNVTLHWILDLEPYDSDEATDEVLFNALGDHVSQNNLQSMSFSISGINSLLSRVNQELTSGHEATVIQSADYWVVNGKVVWYQGVSLTKNGAPVVLSQDPRGELALVAEITRA